MCLKLCVGIPHNPGAGQGHQLSAFMGLLCLCPGRHLRGLPEDPAQDLRGQRLSGASKSHRPWGSREWPPTSPAPSYLAPAPLGLVPAPSGFPSAHPTGSCHPGRLEKVSWPLCLWLRPCASCPSAIACPLSHSCNHRQTEGNGLFRVPDLGSLVLCLHRHAQGSSMTCVLQLMPCVLSWPCQVATFQKHCPSTASKLQFLSLHNSNTASSSPQGAFAIWEVPYVLCKLKPPRAPSSGKASLVPLFFCTICLGSGVQGSRARTLGKLGLLYRQLCSGNSPSQLQG